MDLTGIGIAFKSSDVHGMTSKKLLREYLDKFQPVENGVPLIRIGGGGDGGYLIPDDLLGITECFSPGSDLLWNFERDLAEKYEIRSHICDDITKRPRDLTEFQVFTPLWLGKVTRGNLISLPDWISNSKVNPHEDFLLQIDIEGAEWDVLSHLDPPTLSKFRIIVVEFHFLSQLRNRLAFEKIFKPALDQLHELFDVVHSHPNNCCGYFVNDGINFPQVIEVTFHRKDRAIHNFGFRKIPNSSDVKSVKSRPEIRFPW
jgi:hypothetical protein